LGGELSDAKRDLQKYHGNEIPVIDAVPSWPAERVFGYIFCVSTKYQKRQNMPGN
jgi:hypothetical protein